MEIISSSQEEEESPIDEEMDEEEQGSLSADEDEGSTTSEEEEEKIEGMIEEVKDAELSQTSDNEGDGSKNDTKTIAEAATGTQLEAVEEEEMH